MTLKTAALVLETIVTGLLIALDPVVLLIPLNPHLTPAHLDSPGLITPAVFLSPLSYLPPALFVTAESPSKCVLRGMGHLPR